MKRIIGTVLLPVVLSVCSFSQAKPASTRPASPKPVATASGGSKIGVINMRGAIAGTNEGQRDLGALSKKYESRRAELEKLNEEIEGLKKKLAAQGEKTEAAAREELTKSIETKTKALQRSAEDFQNEVQQQQNEIAQRILQKLDPIITKYVSENGYGILFDVSMPWPQGPVVMAGRSVDITKAVVDAYNAQSGIAAPAKPAAPGAPPTRP